MGYLFLIVAGWATYGIYRMISSGREGKRYLVEGREEEPLRVDHLPPRLALLAEDTRLLRISLEAPVRQIRELMIGDLDTASTEDLDAFDNMLMNVTRQLGEWIRSVEQLPANELASFHDLGLSPEPVRNALLQEGWAFERKNLRTHRGPMDKRLEAILGELRRVESGLQASRSIYR